MFVGKKGSIFQLDLEAETSESQDFCCHGCTNDKHWSVQNTAIFAPSGQEHMQKIVKQQFANYIWLLTVIKCDE